MDSPKPTLELEKELTCSICTELLYQPLTLLDCLHTYCGACLKDWFTFQEIQAENNPTPPAQASTNFTCPSCRATVRDTRHNATVATLLDMYITANPEKARTPEEQADLGKKYKPGDQVIPRHQAPESTPEARRLEEEDRRLIDEVREMSLRDAGVVDSSSSLAPSSRRRRESRSRDDPQGQGRSSRDPSRESAHSRRTDGGRRRHAHTESDVRHAHSGDHSGGEQSRTSDRRRRRRSTSRRRSEAMSEMRRRQVEHQSSLRSLISSDDLNERDMEREIEEFARQIQEEGLLDGLDLDNIDLSQNDALSKKITEAYRRRQRERFRAGADGSSSRRTHTSAAGSRHSPEPTSSQGAGSSQETPTTGHPSLSSSSAETRRPAAGRSRPHSRSASATGYADDRRRPPPAFSAVQADGRAGPEQRRRRRNSSGGRSATTPNLGGSQPEARPAARSQTDLSLLSSSASSTTTVQAHNNSGPRTAMAEGRSSSTPSVRRSAQSPAGSPAGSSAPRDQSFASRVPDPATLVSSNFSSITSSTNTTMHRQNRPADLTVISQATAMPPSTAAGGPASPGHQRPRTQLYPEPSIVCSRCSRPHIEYEIHYNCFTCSSGNWNLCLDCYRSGKGCLHWFGFGSGAWDKWEQARHQPGREDIPRPHMLTANRYLPPKITPGGAEGRRTLTTEDPVKRLESGNFCARCCAWANECYWRCDVCNQGEWGFCNDCVNQGDSCTHPLLPLTYQPPPSQGPPPDNPPSPQPPHAASLLTGPNVPNIGPFKPLTFTTRCDVCQEPIPPSQSRLHCFCCTSSIEPDTKPGDYDVCQSCYASLIARGRISAENGSAGWRRCPQQGHRMVVVEFREGQGGQFRHVVADIVGGRKLGVAAVSSSQGQAGQSGPANEQNKSGLQSWSWFEGERKLQRLVTTSVALTAPTPSNEGQGDGAPGNQGQGSSGARFTDSFPPDGGTGLSCMARFSWYPRAEDELLFPRGAEVREVEDVNGDWFYGAYMGSKGLFPSPYVKILGEQAPTGGSSAI